MGLLDVIDKIQAANKRLAVQNDQLRAEIITLREANEELGKDNDKLWQINDDLGHGLDELSACLDVLNGETGTIPSFNPTKNQNDRTPSEIARDRLIYFTITHIARELETPNFHTYSFHVDETDPVLGGHVLDVTLQRPGGTPMCTMLQEWKDRAEKAEARVVELEQERGQNLNAADSLPFPVELSDGN